jgi:hypothetical protein
MNAMKHTFCGQTCIIPEHEMEAYTKHFESFRKEFRPVGASEEFLVQSLAELTWTTQDSKQNGFVYSIAQIDDVLAQQTRLDRLNLHKKAAA